MKFLRHLPGQLKRHYEKVLLVLALFGLVAAVITLNSQKSAENDKIETYNKSIGKRKPKSLSQVDLTALATALQHSTNPTSLNFSPPHNLFNPVKWQKKPDGTIIKIETGKEVGPNAAQVKAVHVDRAPHRFRQRASRRAVRDRLEREVQHLRDLGPDGPRRVLLLHEVTRRDDAVRLHGHHTAGRAPGEARRAFGDAGGGKEIGDDDRRTRREPVDDAAIIVATATKHELVAEPERGGACVQGTRILEDHSVDAIARVLVGGVETLVDQQRLPEPIRLERCVAERPVLLEPLGALHPVEDVLALRLGSHAIRRYYAQGELVLDVVGVEIMRAARGHEGRRVGGGARFLRRLVFSSSAAPPRPIRRGRVRDWNFSVSS